MMKDKNFIVLRGVKSGSIFYSMNTIDNRAELLEGTMEYEVLGYADTHDGVEVIISAFLLKHRAEEAKAIAKFFGIQP